LANETFNLRATNRHDATRRVNWWARTRAGWPCGTQNRLDFAVNFVDHAHPADELRERMLMEPVAEQSPRSGRKGPLRFFTTRPASPDGDRVFSPSLADLEAARIGLQRRLRKPRSRVIDAAWLRLRLLPAVARAASVLRRS
jgi:hypothetical protein